MENLSSVQISETVDHIWWSLESSGLCVCELAFLSLATKPTKVASSLTSLI